MQTPNLPSTLIFVRRSIKPPEGAGAGFDPRPAITGSSGAPTPQTMGRWPGCPITSAPAPPRLGAWRQCRRRWPTSQTGAKDLTLDQTADDLRNSLTHLNESTMAALKRPFGAAATGSARRRFGRPGRRVRRPWARGRPFESAPGSVKTPQRRRRTRPPPQKVD